LAFKTEHKPNKECSDRPEAIIETDRWQSERTAGPEDSDRLPGTCDKTLLFNQHTPKDNSQILVVDDASDIQRFPAHTLSIMGYESVGATSWIEALKLFKAGDFDLVFTDSKIIGWDGFSLAFHIKAISPEVPVVMLIDKNRNNSPDNQEGCCIDYLLFKPFGSKDIQHAIRKFYVVPSREKDVDFHSKSNAL